MNATHTMKRESRLYSLGENRRSADAAALERDNLPFHTAEEKAHFWEHLQLALTPEQHEAALRTCHIVHASAWPAAYARELSTITTSPTLIADGFQCIPKDPSYGSRAPGLFYSREAAVKALALHLGVAEPGKLITALPPYDSNYVNKPTAQSTTAVYQLPDNTFAAVDVTTRTNGPTRELVTLNVFSLHRSYGSARHAARQFQADFRMATAEDLAERTTVARHGLRLAL